MPRKKDGMPFEMHPTPAKGKDGKILYYPRPLSEQKITMKGLDEYCAKYYGLRPLELTRAFEAFVMATGYYLSEGYRIETPIGSFAPRLRVVREITDPDDVKGRDVRFDGVEYNSGKLWYRPGDSNDKIRLSFYEQMTMALIQAEERKPDSQRYPIEEDPM